MVSGGPWPMAMRLRGIPGGRGFRALRGPPGTRMAIGCGPPLTPPSRFGSDTRLPCRDPQGTCETETK